MSESNRLLLASGSPRRIELLTRAGVTFDSCESGIDESPLPGETAREYAIRLARDKALAVSRRAPGRWVLAADTVVECEGAILGKPADAGEARAMLRLLANRTHEVTTAFAIARADEVVECDAVQSRVSFRAIGEDEIDGYVRSGDPFDKAGGYGIQGAGATFITNVDGPRDNVMGLPVDRVLDALRRHGLGG
jgi:septum formation protein